MHLHVQLALGRNLVETSTACITLNIYDTESVACILTNTLETCQQTWLDLCLDILRLIAQALFLLTSLLQDIIQLRLLLNEILLTFVNSLLSLLQILGTSLHASCCFLYFLFTEFNLKRLILNLLAQGVILTVVLHLVELCLITFNDRLCRLYLAFLLRDSPLEVVHLLLYVLHTGAQSLNLVLQVLHLQRQLTTQRLLLVDLRQCGLQLIEILQLLLYRKVFRIFLCHNN